MVGFTLGYFVKASTQHDVTEVLVAIKKFSRLMTIALQKSFMYCCHNANLSMVHVDNIAARITFCSVTCANYSKLFCFVHRFVFLTKQEMKS
jgi:hypothetical protein